MDEATNLAPAEGAAGADLLDWLEEAVLVFDAGLHCVQANAAARKLFLRLPVGEAAGRLLEGADGPAFAAQLAEAARIPRPARLQNICIGRRCHYEVSALAQPDGRLLACFRDITDRRRNQAVAALQQQAHALRLRRAGLGEMLALLSAAAEAHFGDGSTVEFLVAGNTGGSPRHLDPKSRLPPALRQAFERSLGAAAEAPFAEVWSSARTSDIVRIADDPGWAPLHAEAAAHRLHAAWAMPVVAPGRVIAAMVVYYLGDALPPEAEHRDLLFADFVCGIASIALERAQDRERQSRTEALLRDEVRVSETLNGISAALATELDLATIVQAVTDGATALTGAQFGAFFYNTTDAQGAMMLLYALSGSGREIFSRLPVPRPTAIFAHTFGGRGPLRMDDVLVDPRYGLSPPFSGLPPGHPQVRSYLAVPVISPSGRGVIGGIFLGHFEPAIFNARHETLISGVAAQAAIAVENARLVASLRESADRLALALSATDLGDWRLDIRSGMLGFSDTAARIFGLEGTLPMARSSFADRLDPEDRVAFDAALDTALASGSRFEAEFRIRRSDGVRRVTLRGIVHRSSDASVAAGMFGVVQDVTLSRQMESDLRERAQQLAEADRRKDEFLATLAHELRNPLAPLRTSLEILRRGELAPAVREQARSIMARQVTQMARLVDELIDISRISSGRIELQKEPTELAAMVEAAIEIARPLIDRGQHRLTVRLPTPAPVLLIDRTRAAQVLSNLLNNAAKYTPAAGEIELEAGVEEGWLAIAVRDNGIGIEPQMLAHIFEMFVQGHAGSDAGQLQGGLGVGLTLARRLVELHGGSLEAGSGGPGRGSEFIVRLPLPVAADAAAALPAAPPALRVSRRQVLVVDDNLDSASSMQMILEAEGHAVEVAHDGWAALQAVERKRPDVALLDIGLPGLDGYEVAERIRQGDPARRILLIATTGWGQAKDREKSDRAGFDRHLVKPVDPELVIRLIAESVAAASAGAARAAPAPPTAAPPAASSGAVKPSPFAPDAADGDPAATVVPEAPAAAGGALRVLVVDDSPLMRESAAAILESEGYAVRTAGDGIEALEVVETWAPRIVMLDLHMPRLGGIETARRLRERYPPGALGLLMMSGVSLDAEWLGHAKAAGFDECLDKTADPEDWLGLLRRLAGSLAA